MNSRSNYSFPALLAAVLVYCGQSLGSPNFTTGLVTGNVQGATLTEASGIAASRQNPNVLWSINDSGNPNQIFPLTSAGANLGTYSLTGTTNLDWEDIAVGPGPILGAQYLYVADIGDNLAIRSTIAVYRVPEPTVSDIQSPVTTSLSGATRLTLAYPDGARDAESMFVDPLTSDIYIITKRESPKRVYRAAYPQSTSGTTTLEFMTSFTSSTWLTAADISPDGNEILVRSAESTSGRLFTRPIGGSITDAFNAGSITVPLSSEPQGEAIGFDATGRGYFTVSEGSNQPIYYFNRTPPPASASYWDNDGVAAGSYVATGAGLGGSGVWNTTSFKWYNGGAVVPWLAGNNAVFWGTAGTVTLAGTQTAHSVTFKTNGFVLTSGVMQMEGPEIIVDSGVTATISSSILGSAGLSKRGMGTLRLSNANLYTGGTTVEAGKLVIATMMGSGTGPGNVSVSSGATISGYGFIHGNLTNAGVTSPGESIGTLSVDGAYVQTTGGRLEIEIASAESHDSLAVDGSASLGGSLAVTLAGSYSPLVGTSFQILTASGFGGTIFDSVELPSLTNNLEWSLSYGTNAVTLFVSQAGDFNRDGAVDGADYVWWRKFNGTSAGYNLWRANFGLSEPASAATRTSASVPEPTQFVAGLIVVLTLMAPTLRLYRTATRI